jgi:hypothetical protein
MESAVAEHIFEPFFPTRQPGKGTGLGLAIVHAIVTAGNGLINVDSVPGHGAMFEIFFPRLEEEIDAVPIFNDRDLLAVDRPLTLLLVDSQPQVRHLLHDCLRSSGYELLEAADSEQALIVASLHDGPIDLLVTGISMARLDGPRLAMRLAEVRPQTKVLLMADQPDDVSPHDVDVSLIRKPFTKEALLDCIKQILN